MRLRNLTAAVLLAAGLGSCEKDISIALHDTEQEIVVDGSIESGRAPVVILTRSLDYFSRLDTALLKDLFVHDAVVTVAEEGGNTVTLREYQQDTLSGKYYYYSSDTSDPHPFRGRPGKTYRLEITAGTARLQAVTAIPAGGFRLDSLWWIPGIRDEKPDSTQLYLMARIVDPPEPGNHARYFTRRNHEPFLPGLNSVANDEITNGTTFDFLIDRGISKNDMIDFDDYGYFDPGDTVTLKFCNIDKSTFDFWSTWEYAWSSSGNPFSSPIAVKSNIQGGLGYWGGYAAQYRTLVIGR